MTQTFDWYDGYLCLKVVDTLWSTPTRYTSYYPFFKAPFGDVAHLVGTEAQRVNGAIGLYGTVGSDDRRIFQLQDMARTRPIHNIHEPEPCPRVRKGLEVRWQDGQWEKLLKSGWKPV